jgi:hypothetical protein
MNKQMHIVLEDQNESIHVSGWDDGKVWMNLMIDRAGVRVILTKSETERLIEMLQTAMAEKEAT